MKFTKIPEDTFQNLQLNAGVLLSEFDPTSGKLDQSKQLGATTGGSSFKATPEFSDFGEDIDNCPNNMMELKKLTSWTVEFSGTFVSMKPDTAKGLVGAADTKAESKLTTITPRNDVKLTDYATVWWVGDYGGNNSEEDGGFIAIKLINALSTGGFQIQSTKDGKGTFPFTYTGHYSMKEQDKVPFEIYIQETDAETLSARCEVKVPASATTK